MDSTLGIGAAAGQAALARMNNSYSTSPSRPGAMAQEQTDFAAMLKSVQKQQDPRVLDQATMQMESIFLNLMWQEMRATVPKSGLMPMGLAGDIYQDMLYQAYSDQMAETGTGLAAMLKQQLTADTKSK